jgi:hypothetical protein
MIKDIEYACSLFHFANCGNIQLGAPGEYHLQAGTAPRGYRFLKEISYMSNGETSIDCPNVDVMNPNNATSAWWTEDNVYHIDTAVDRTGWTWYLEEIYVLIG